MPRVGVERCPGKVTTYNPAGLENLEETGRLLAPARRERRGQIRHRVFTGRAVVGQPQTQVSH